MKRSLFPAVPIVRMQHATGPKSPSLPVRRLSIRRGWPQTQSEESPYSHRICIAAEMGQGRWGWTDTLSSHALASTLRDSYWKRSTCRTILIL